MRSDSSARLVRNPDLLLSWSGDSFLVKDLAGGNRIYGGPELLAVLDLFGRPLSPAQAARALATHEKGDVLALVRRLEKMGLLLPAHVARRRVSRLRVWNENLASAQYHLATRDSKYARGRGAVRRLLMARAAEESPPPPYKRYRTAERFSLPEVPQKGAAEAIERVLSARRTVRHFSQAPVPLEDFTSAVRGTWGQTGWLSGGPAGPAVAKTSPSAGGRHPIECYVLAWNVAGLPRGLYHYDVAGDELRCLRRGVFQKAAVESASGQLWIGKAAFLCVMTAVFERTLWRYRYEGAYRALWLDAGHLAQTFCLLATSRGLGPFTTAAIQDSYLEDLIGLDGIKEFPVYLCGAGVPVKRRTTGRIREAADPFAGSG